MSQSETTEEKTLPPSAKKLRKAREKGQIAHSKEMVGALITLAVVGYLVVRFTIMFDQLRDGLEALPDLLSRPFPEAAFFLITRLSSNIALTLAPFIGLIVGFAVLGNIMVNGGILAAVDPILPKMERLDPVAGFKRMFGLKSLIELIKSLVKLIVIGGLTLFVIGGALQAMMEIPACGMRCTGPVFRAVLLPLLFTTAVFFLVIGGLDVGLQKWLFRREMRMTKTEQKRETKESEGNPLIRRQHRQDRSAAALRTGLRNATFVIWGDGIALAMRFKSPDSPVPVLVARGVDDGAANLVGEARTLGLPIVFNAEAAALVSPRLRVGRIITQEMFLPVIECMNEAGVI